MKRSSQYIKPRACPVRRIAAVSEYAFDDADGNNMVLDLAVTSTNYPQGNIHTIDVTEPYNPKPLGVVTDSSGAVVDNIFATDITISKAAGLVYATTSNAVYVIDIKDPYHPVVLNVITEAPNADGTMMPLGYSPAVAEKDGWLYLANNQKGLRVLDLDPVWLEHYRVEEAFPDSYYPALGEKTITLRGRGPELYDQPLNTTNNHGIPPKVKLVSYTPAQGVSIRSKVAGDENRATFDVDGLARFYIETGSSFGETKVTLNFELDLTTIYGGGTQLQGNPNAHRKTVNLIIKDNSNVTVSDVINGQAVFVADGKESLSTGTGLNNQKFDFVKELLNQVVPRKRSLTFAPLPDEIREADSEQNKYPYHQKAVVSMLDEANSIFDITTEEGRRTAQALEIFRRSFGMEYTTVDNASLTFRKLMRDYNKTSVEKPRYLYRIVDKETLVGNDFKIGASPDQVIGKETGLYELYANVVEKFVDRMVKEAERYAGLRVDVGDPPTANWLSRDGIGPEQDPQYVATGMRGMSYSYGGRQSVDNFNRDSANVEVARRGVVQGCNIDLSNEKKMLFYTSASGNYGIDTASCSSCHTSIPTNKKVVWKDIVDSAWVESNYEGNVPHYDCNNIGGGYQKYPGLKKVEFNSVNSYWIANFLTGEVVGATVAFPQFNGSYWAGTDCSNLVVKSVVAAKLLDIPSVNVSITDPMYSGQLCQCNQNPYTSEHTYPIAATQGEAKDEQKAKYLRKGDLISYDGHVSIVYSKKWGESSWSEGGIWDWKRQKWATRKLNYDIIHAYGSSRYAFKVKKKLDTPFSRKVVVTGDYIGSAPTGIGRIKLWD